LLKLIPIYLQSEDSEKQKMYSIPRRVCIFISSKGPNKNRRCNNQTKIGSDYCSKHATYQQQKATNLLVNRETKRRKREDHEYRTAEQQSNTTRRSAARQDPEYRAAEQQLDTATCLRRPPQYFG